LDKTYKYNDFNTADDGINALVDFFNKFPEYKGRRFFIAGESYAGKYIPDLAVQIDLYNLRGEGTAINLLSIIIGNGVMSFDTLQKSTYEYMIDRKFVDPEIVPIYQSSCQTDPHSAGCRFFEIEYGKGTEEVNPYNVYGYCFYNDSFDLSQTKGGKKVFSSQ
jgi:serine carboxypeptidase-like clade 2